jgi:hypothetical protein
MGEIHHIFKPAPSRIQHPRVHKISTQRRCPFPAVHIPSEDRLATRAIFRHGQEDQFSFTIGLIYLGGKEVDGNFVCTWQLVVSPEGEQIRQAIDAPTKAGRPSVMEMLKSVPVMLEHAPLMRGAGLFCTVTHRGALKPDIQPASDFLHAASRILSDHLSQRGFFARLFRVGMNISVPENAWANNDDVVRALTQLSRAAESLLHRLEVHPDISRVMIEKGIDFAPRDDHTLYLDGGGVEQGAQEAIAREQERWGETICDVSDLSDAEVEAIPEQGNIPSSQTIVPNETPSGLPSQRRDIPPPLPSGIGDTFIPGGARRKPPNLARRVTPSGRKKK